MPKVGKRWRKAGGPRGLPQGERAPGDAGRELSSFLRVPDKSVAIAENMDILHRLDSAFFGWASTGGGLLVKF